ncbi:MAG: radical SAM protein [Thermoanaerobaculia bacterium]
MRSSPRRSRSLFPKSARGSTPRTAPPSSSCASPTAPPSRRSTSRRRNAEPCASPVRRDAASRAPSASPDTGAGRNLTAGEIVAQVLLVRRLQHLPPTLNLVFMGMGEPLLNVESVHTALELLSESISWRRMTVSTAGVVPGLDAMAAWDRRPNLAISLHAPDDTRRDEIMPINRSYPLAELLDALRRFPLEPRRRITIEYILLAGFNDAPGDAAALARLLRKIPVKINLIPFNPDPVLGDRFVRPSPEAISRFQEELAARQLTATVRRTRGDDVGAACGQLRAFAREPRARNPRRPPRGEVRS